MYQAPCYVCRWQRVYTTDQSVFYLLDRHGYVCKTNIRKFIIHGAIKADRMIIRPTLASFIVCKIYIIFIVADDSYSFN